MRRFSLWMRAHPMAGDSAVALLIAVLDIGIYLNGPERARWYVTLPVVLATVLPIVFRRRHPVTVAYVVLVTGAVHAALELPLAAIVTSGIAVYTLVVYVGRRHAAFYVAVLSAASVVQILVEVERDRWMLSIGFSIGVYVFSWLLGEFLGARRAYQAELEARLELLESERDHLARLAVADERGRIARELHDIVAHSVSVIVVHADGARYTIDSDPAAACRAMDTISETGRSALTELRRLVDVLRNPDSETEPLQPQPGVDALTDLVDRVRASGLDVRVERADDLDDLDAGLALGVHRVVQEALTNVLKHARTSARTYVSVERDAAAVHVTVTDDGAGKANPVEAAPPAPAGGNGIIGMRERVHVFGGTLSVGPRPGGGWYVHATFPTAPAEAGTGGQQRDSSTPTGRVRS
ncbi:Signal transduction histidine kinase [Haloechinothrix alba]|uniref:histidine kinase n=1 Tax=Haloechinothrix alba TaxID=664784 RepID=A0A238UZU7_9PSEU|nr:Signal transduction histidine kinase [Haloechinothrix alba]